MHAEQVKERWAEPSVQAVRRSVEDWVLQAESTRRAPRNLSRPIEVATLLVVATDPLTCSRRAWNVPFERLTRYALQHPLERGELEWFLDRARLLTPNLGVIATQGAMDPRLWLRVLAEERSEHSLSVVRWREERRQVLERVGRRTVGLVLQDVPRGASRREVTLALEEVMDLTPEQDEVLEKLLDDREGGFVTQWGRLPLHDAPSVTELVELARLV